jgi:hypothetical protein
MNAELYNVNYLHVINPSTSLNLRGFQLLTAVTVTISVMWDVTPCSVVECPDVSEDHAVAVVRVDDEDSRMLCTRRHINTCSHAYSFRVLRTLY